MGRSGPERSVEDAVVEIAARLGGLAFKMNPQIYAGIPDRLVLLPGGVLFFCETKAPLGIVSKIQAKVHGVLEALGFDVHVPTTRAAVEEMFDEYAD
jgi:hypothetical protein